jgi:hypothetical protein
MTLCIYRFYHELLQELSNMGIFVVPYIGVFSYVDREHSELVNTTDDKPNPIPTSNK